ncbi:hypothetical protein [Sulfuriferula thiophila]|uniref:hypothetical protein n=1 Tax=Sulfuriferula thiophila TaxID=1781211 RepID=UPI000F60FBA6|nr:hypothetical protein [Sulfuriferula thiophila]
MKRFALPLALISGLAITNVSHAADWMSVQGLEPANAEAYKIWGFLQPTYTYIDSKPVTGLGGSISGYNGQQQIPNLVGPDLEHTSNIQLFRARLGMRGKLKPVDDRINYFLLLEAGRNGVTRDQSVVLSDASMTFSYIPGMHLRAGLFKLPTGEEALSPVHVDYNYINFTSVTDGLLNERDMTAKAGTAPAGLAIGNVMGSLSGFRDIGVEAFNTFRHNRWEFGYAAMVSNGNNINFITDNNHHKDFTGRLQVSYIFNGAGPARQDVNAFIWHQEGKRTFNGSDYNRMREGLGFKYLKDNLRFSGEAMRGAGMIYNGPNPPFNDISGANTPAPNDTIALQDYNKADGWYLEGGYKFLPQWRANLKYDVYHRLTNAEQAANQRNFKTITIGGEYLLSKSTHFTMTYEIRSAEVANPLAISTTNSARANALAIADNLGNRISLQMTHIF